MSYKRSFGFQSSKTGGAKMIIEVKLNGLTFSQANAQEVESLKARGFVQVNNRQEGSNLYMVFSKKNQTQKI